MNKENDDTYNLVFLDQNISSLCPEFPRTDSWFKEGGLSYVYHSQFEEKDVAVKLYINLNADDKERFKNLVIHNLDLTSLDHPSLMKVYKTIKENDLIMGFVCEDCGEETMNYCSEMIKDSATLIKYLSTMEKIIEGVEYLNTNGLYHLDIKNCNITIDPIKLIDYDLISPLRELDKKFVFGSPLFCCPEMLCGEITETSDVYSLGVVLYTLIEGINSLEAKYESDDLVWQITTLINYKNKLETNYEFRNEKFNKENIVDLIQEMLSVVPEKRPKISEVKERYGSWLESYLKN